MKSLFMIFFLLFVVVCDTQVNAIADSEIYIRTGPLVTSFELDMNFGRVTLHFDMEVLARTLDSRLVVLQSSLDGDTNTSSFSCLYRTATDLWVLGNTSDVQFFLHRDDFARFVTHAAAAPLPFVTRAEDTFLSMTAGAVLSSFGYPSEPILSNASLAVSEGGFTADTKSPYVHSFGLDMDAGLLTVAFTEPMDPLSFTLQGLALQDRANGLQSDQYVALKATPWSCNVTHDYGRVFECDLGRENLDAVKRVNNLCSANTTSFLSVHEEFASDLAGNLVGIEGFDRIFGMMTSNYTADWTAPELQYWAVDLNLGTLTLFFSEPLFMPLFNYSGVIVCNRPTLDSSTAVMRVHEPIITSYENTAKITIQLNDEQFNFIKFSEDLATGDGTSADTFLLLEPFLGRDTSPQQNLFPGTVAMNGNGTMALSNMTQDHHSPELRAVALDMTAETLTLTWNEVVSIASVDLTELVLQSSEGILVLSETIAIPGISNMITIQDSKTIIFSLSNIFSEIKAKDFLFRSIDSTFVAFTYRFLDDQAGNDVVQIPSSRARQALGYTPDHNPPWLVSWTIDLDADQLVLSFSEPLDIDSFCVDGLVLSNRLDASFGADMVKLTKTSTLSKRVLNDLYIDLSYEDANLLKSTASVCTESSNCFLSFTDVDGEAVGYDVTTYDMASGDAVRNAVEYATSVGLAPLSFLTDVSPPVLLSFDVDLDAGHLYLTFSEPVQTGRGALNASGISFFNNHTDDGGVSFLILSVETFSESVDADASFIKLVLTRQDFYTIKKEGNFGPDLSEATLWMTVANFTFLDSSDNHIDARVIGASDSQQHFSSADQVSYLAAENYFADDAGATIVAVRASSPGVDTDITIYFDDVLQVDSLTQANIFLASFEAIRSISLGGATLVTSAAAPASELTFSTTPILASLSATVTVFSSQYHSYVYMSGTSVARDTSGNWNPAMQVVSAVRTGGALVYFRLDMTARLLAFETVFPMSVSLANVLAPEIRLINVQTNEEFIFTAFTDVETSADGYFITVALSSADVAQLQAQQLVGSREDMRLEVTSTAMVNSLDSLPLNASTTLRCAQLLNDLSVPMITSVELHLGTGRLTLVFSEHVVVSSIDILKLSLSDAVTNAVATVALENSALSAETLLLTTTDTVIIDLTAGGRVPTDRDRLHLSGSVGRSLGETNLIVRPGFVHDTRGGGRPNYLEPIGVLAEGGGARPVDVLVPDMVPPQLLSYSVDFTARAITFIFDEAVNPASTKPSEFIFLPSPAMPNTDLYSLSDLSVVSDETLARNATNSVVVSINGSDVDDIMLRYPNVLSSLENTYLAFPTGVIRDIAHSSNAIEEVFKIYALAPKKFVSDSVPPLLVWFDLSIHTRLIHFWFDEMMNCFLTDVSKISFQYRDFTGKIEKVHHLNPNSTKMLDCRVDNYITRDIWVQLGHEDIRHIKLIPSLMKTAATTALRLERGAFADVVGTDVEPLLDAHTLAVRTYEGDFTRPRLSGFTVTLQGLMHVKFSEPILLSSFDFTSIKITDARVDGPYQLSLTNPPSYLVEVNENHDRFTLYIRPQYQWLLDTTDMFDRQDSVYITFPSNLASDTFGNEVFGNTNLTATNMGPGIDGWDLNMDTHHIFIYFSEKMIENFTISSVKLQNAAMSPTDEVQLTGTPQGLTFFDHSPFHDEGTAFSAKLSSSDIDRLKVSSLLTPLGLQSLFLWAPLALAKSAASSTVVPHMNSTETLAAVQVTEFLPDVTGPVIALVTLDLNAGQLLILFDEPVHGAALDVRKIALLSDAYGNSISLTSLDDVLQVNSSLVTINLTVADLNAVKYSYTYGTLDKIRCQVDFITDLFGNILVGDVELAYEEFIVSISVFVPDTTPPQLLAFSLDLSRDTLDIVFDELVEHWSLHPMHIQLLSSSNTSHPDTDFLQLSNYSVVLGDADSRQSNITVDLGLLRADAFRLQAEALIGQNVTTTFLHISGVTDIAGNERHSNTSIIRVTDIKSDVSPPKLEAFDFDLGGSVATVTLYFSELMDISTFDCAEFYFANEQAETPTETVMVVTGDCTVSTVLDSRVISYTVAASMFSSGAIGAAAASTFVYAPTTSSSADPAGNVLQALDAPFAKMVGAQVVGFLLDVSGDGTGTVDIIFSKDVDRASFDGNKIGFYSQETSEDFIFEGSVNSVGFLDSSPMIDFIITVDVSMHNLIRLKNISIAEGDMLLVVNASCATDSNGVDVAVARPRDNKVASKFVRDFSRPIILSLSIDMSTNLIIVEFNEPIDTITLHIEKLTLQSAAGALSDASVYSHQFTGGSFESAFTDASVLYTFVLSNDDFGSIKLMAPNLATSLANTFISIDFSAFADVSGNMYPTVDPLNALQFNVFEEDSLAPRLEHFELDVDNALLTLVCSEPMRADTVNVSEIVLQSRYYGGPQYGDDLQYRLSAASSKVTSENGSSIVIQIGGEDMFNIRNTPNLVRKQISTYIILSGDTATDLAGIQLTEIIDGEAYRAHVYLPDVTKPVVERIVVDFSSDTISFHFSETVWTEKANVRALRIQGDATNSLQLYHDFQVESNVLANADEPFSSYISFQIGLADLNAIKWRHPLGTSRETAFFAWGGGLVTDVFSNQAVATSNLTASAATTFIADQNPPLLLNYHLDMNALVMYLEFSESIYLPLSHLEQGILQRTFVKRFGNHVNLSFALASSGSDAASNLFQIQIDNRTSHIMKYYSIAVSQETSFFTYGSEFVADGFRNFISPLWDGSVQGHSPRLPEVYVKDTTKPALLQWFVDYEQPPRLFLVFTEPVRLLDCTALSFEFSSGFNFSFTECSTEYLEFGTTLVYRLLDAGVVTCEAADGHTETETCSTYQLGFSGNSNEAVTLKLLQQQTGEDPAYLSIAEGALADYAEIPNFSAEVIAVAELGPDCSPCQDGTYLTVPCTASSDRVCGTCTECGVREWMVGECSAAQDTQCLACSDCRYGSYISQACSSTADTHCSDCTRCVELEVEIRECVEGLDAICDSCKRCSFEDAALKDIGVACEVTEKYYYWKNENCCRTSFEQDVPCDELEVIESKYKLGLY